MRHASIYARRFKATVFKAAAIERWEDARCLTAADRFQGAVYLCGYALECELKFRVCLDRGISYLEEAEAKKLGHQLPELLDAAGLSDPLTRKKDLLVAFQAIARSWSTEMRYTGGRGNKAECERFLRDTNWLLIWLRTESKS